jgi:hypothetical protein
MISIAIARGLFVLPGSAGDETMKEEEEQTELADRVGKWLVLRERWPDVAVAAEKDSQLIERLENAARQDGMQELRDCLISTKISGVEDLGVLKELLEKDPRLGDLSRLALLSGGPSAAPDLPRFGLG